jgi:hypothetical protein
MDSSDYSFPLDDRSATNGDSIPQSKQIETRLPAAATFARL